MKGVKENQSRQLANDLRKSHWSFGSSGAKSTASEYVSEYQRKNASLERSQKDKLNVRASHFQLGNQDSHNTFKTISQKDYKEHVGFQAPKLNEDKKRDLRSSHFVLGNSQPQFGSLSHLTFQEKPIPTQQKFEQEVQKTKMRKHNHDFTETNKNQFSSEYNKNFNRLTDPSSLKQALSAQELKQKVIDLRKSHVVLGGDHRPMHSIAQLDYQSKQGDLVAPANDNVNIRRTNFQLGTAPAEFGSLYQQNFVAHPTQKSEIQENLAKDLRATHFSLGGEGAIYTSNNAASYKAQIGFKPPQTLNPNLQQNHFSLGAIGDQIANKTTYSSFHKNFGNGAVTQARDQTMDRGSNWQLGGQQGTWASEAQSRFVSHDGAKPGDMDKSLKADLRSSHFRFTDVKPNSQFVTVQKQSYGVQKADPNKLDEALKKDLQANHFKLGSSVTTYGSSTAVAYKFHNGKPSVLDPSLAKDLRANHFTHGDGKWQVHAGTEYRANFFWKNNEEQNA